MVAKHVAAVRVLLCAALFLWQDIYLAVSWRQFFRFFSVYLISRRRPVSGGPHHSHAVTPLALGRVQGGVTQFEQRG